MDMRHVISFQLAQLQARGRTDAATAPQASQQTLWLSTA